MKETYKHTIKCELSCASIKLINNFYELLSATGNHDESNNEESVLSTRAGSEPYYTLSDLSEERKRKQSHFATSD